MKRIAVIACTLLLLAFLPAASAFCEAQPITVTIYNQNRGLINEVRDLSIPKGIHLLEFRDVAETVDPTSLQVRSLTAPESFKVLDQNYEYDLINVQNLLNKYISKRLKIIVPDPQGPPEARVVRDAVLLANNDRPIFQIDASDTSPSSPGRSEIYVGSYDAILLPEIPEGLRPQPTLLWLVDNRGPEQHKVEVSYLAGNINWKADYVLRLDRESTQAALSGWVTLDNQSGKAFKNATLKLVAGDVHMVSRPERQVERARALMAPSPMDEAMRQEEFFEYHLYSLSRPVDIANRQTKQVGLLQSPQVKVERRLVGRWTSSRGDSGRPALEKQKLSVLLHFKNTTENGIGIPLPKGVARAYQESSDGSVIFIGEDYIDHTGKDRDVELKMGESFDVTVERRQTDFRKIGTNTVRFSWELKIKNSKDVTQRVELEEGLPGTWKMVSSNTKYEKMDAYRIRFIVDAPPSAKGAEAVVTYEVEASW
jgi:hypothetical protein